MIENFEAVPVGSILVRDKKPRERYRVIDLNRKLYGRRETLSLTMVKVDADGNRVGSLKRHLDDTDGNREGWSVVSVPES